MSDEFDGKHCSECGGEDFSIVQDEWMKRTFKFVETGQLKMCGSCGAKFLVCKECGNLYTRVHPALEAWEVSTKCPSCGFVDPDVKAWDGVSAR
jgi:Zn finger protein HypA/HybF involved in hydrogenase expression